MSHVQTLVPPLSSAASPPSPIWTVRWSPCGRFLATGGKDGQLRIWTLIGLDGTRGDEPATPPPPAADAGTPGWSPKFLVDQPWLEFAGHQGDVLDIAWNRAGCVASASTDKSVRVWHLRRALSSALAPHGGGAANEMLPLAVFQHGDFVPSVAFHPTDDWVFVTGCFDGKVRVWSLDEKRLVASVDMSPSYITAVQFVRDGQWVAAGTYAGMLAMYRLEAGEVGGLVLRNQVSIRSKPSRGATAAAAAARPRKITGIEPWPDPAGNRDILVVASNDSRVRIVDAVD
ncbi:WD40-repeat-containing domain protein, partial [Catenaria anguillulae PL171]